MSNRDFSTLAGPFEDLPIYPRAPYRVQYRKLPSRRPVRTLLVTMISPLLVLAFLIFLLQPANWKTHHSGMQFTMISVTMTVMLALMELIRFVNVISLCRSSILARDPIPVRPDPSNRVAFIVTYVPQNEPLEMLRTTLLAARRIRYDGYMEIFVLDEGNAREVQVLCDELGVTHFSRKPVQEWCQTSPGPYRARTKYGNINAWLTRHGHNFDIVCGVDVDHVPVENFCERLLGYFRDNEVAFVVGPQVYGNSQTNLIARMAESQQFPFHTVVQRAGNRSESAMFVGTNYAFRVSAIQSIGGVQPSITEDAFTSVVLHKKGWKSVYTPDVLAIGEGPSDWSSYFTQQGRWARGTMEIWRHPSLIFGQAPKKRLNYLLMFTFYPAAALTWLLGALNCMLYLSTGIVGIESSSALWILLYVDAAFFQTVLYVWNRRHNISPHEPAGSFGFAGLMASSLVAPLFTKALLDTVKDAFTGDEPAFKVTPKGGSSGNADSLRTFRYHWFWGGCIILAAALGFHNFSRMDQLMWVWSGIVLLLCVMPWLLSHSMNFFRPSPTRIVEDHRSVLTDLELEEVKT